MRGVNLALFRAAARGYRRVVVPGPDVVLACPHCAALARVPTVTSGSTLGGKAWTDGRTELPEMPAAITATRCPGCARVFFVEDAEVGEFDERAPLLAPLAGEAWLTALMDGAARTREQALELRLQAWWASNDPFREDAAAWVAIERRAPAEVANAAALLEMLDTEVGDEGLLKAELLRELGRFAEALAVLAALPDEPEWRRVSSRISRLAERGVAAVQRLELH